MVFPLALISALAVQWGLQVAAPLEEQRLKEELNLVARAVRLPIGESLASGNLEEIQNALDSIFTIGRVYGATVFDTDGTPIASIGTSDNTLNNSRVAQDAFDSGETQERYREIDGKSVFSQFLPVYTAGGHISGLVQITRRESDFDQATDRMQWRAWSGWALATASMAVIVLLGHYRGVGRHVRDLVRSMRRVESGDRSVRASAGGPRELQLLSTTFNRMLDGLQQAEHRLAEHRAEEQALNQRLQRQERLAAIGRMASGVAHELGAPLSVIAGRARRLRERHPLSPEQLRQLEKIERQVDRLNRTVHQLLDYCRPEGQARTRVPPARLARRALDEVSPEWPESRPGPTLILDDDLPDIPVDADRVTLALVNLLRNAAQADPDSVELEVALDGPDAVSYRVRDRGPGLSQSQEQLIQPFNSTKPAGQGIGLGLAIVHQVAQEHDGTLHLANRSDGGCEVVLSFSTTDPDTEEGQHHA
ncbi:hypothetical protein GCM10007392_42790 [Saccharospirillum salsuginis]|uniref:histidine kinase n=1 Tax=Saccharospirillum salsuginis TaxID=418750 RepID=A0A918KRJ2_9GAMM|nr:hypothetical protein GCM10007392_42790 [Saccharospirillum salsuginis]